MFDPGGHFHEACNRFCMAVQAEKSANGEPYCSEEQLRSMRVAISDISRSIGDGLALKPGGKAKTLLETEIMPRLAAVRMDETALRKFLCDEYFQFWELR